MSINVSPELAKECRSLSNQIERRYGSPMFRKMFGENEAYARECAAGFIRANIDAQSVLNVKTWLAQGLKPFSEYPPSIEMMIQIARIVKSCPITETQAKYADYWYKLDAQFSQGYGRFWRAESTIDGLQRERVWLTEFEAFQASSEELSQALFSISESVVFRSYPPSLEQFKGALLSLRKGGAPLVEEAWLLALSIRPGQPLHPLIIKARSKISAFDLNTNGKNWENEQRFKAAYLNLLKSDLEDEALEAVYEPEMASTVEYATTDDLLAALKNMSR